MFENDLECSNVLKCNLFLSIWKQNAFSLNQNSPNEKKKKLLTTNFKAPNISKFNKQNINSEYKYIRLI